MIFRLVRLFLSALFVGAVVRILVRPFDRHTRDRIDMIEIGVVVRIDGQVALFQLFLDKIGDARVDHDEHRHAEQHSPEAEQPRAEDDREHDPEAVDADRAAEDLRQ